jgi:PTS system galactitol-specific IIB component
MSIRPVTIIVACGTGAIGAQVAADKLKRAAAARKIPVNLVTCLTIQMKNLMANTKADMIVSTTMINTNYGVPYYLALAFLTGIGEKELLDEIMDAAEKMSQAES